MTGALMAYAQTDGSSSNRGPTMDYRFGRVYGWDVLTPEVRWFDAFPQGGKQQFSRTGADIAVAGLGGPYTLAYRAQYVVVNVGPSNGGQLLFLDPSNFSLMGSFGTADSSFTNSTTHIQTPDTMVSFRASKDGIGGAADILVCNSTTTPTNAVINAVTVNGYNDPNLGGLTGKNHALLGAIPDGSGTCAWAIGYTKLGADSNIDLWQVAPGLTFIKHVQATDIDATWATVDGVYGITVDQTDGNLIIGVSTLGAATITAYLLKLNAVTGAVMWRFNAGSGVAYDPSDDMPKNWIQNGTLYYLDFHQTLWTINTLTGTSTSQALDAATLGLHRSQCSEDVFGSITWFGAWSESTTHPSYVGYYCGTLGNHSGTSLTWRYFPNGVPSPPPTYGIAAQSRRRAWTFTLDGHTMYCLDLGGEGTYLFDKTTGNWCKWITSGYLGWDLVNGTKWGQRIVGGDYLTTDVLELVPAAVQDNGGLAITHVVTGGLVKRSRVYSSLEAFNLACSTGQLDMDGSTVLLSFSDDQGATWTDCDTLSLTQANYSSEIAWRSLGSFAGPGRLFRITDVGGFLRIDGADAQLDDFDNDTPQQQPGG